MEEPEALDALFQEAVAAIDAGDISALDHLLLAHPELAARRLVTPGAWLRDRVGGALDAEGFFRAPYLLWFVAEDPVRNGTLPANIAAVAARIAGAARETGSEDLQAQLDRALLLVAWSSVAADRGVQLALIDTLIDAGASPAGVPNNALVNRHAAAAERLVARGAPLDLACALCLDRFEDAARLAPTAAVPERQFALVLAALNGHKRALEVLIRLGVDVNSPCPNLYSHATPLHHAVSSGSLPAVRVLVEAGARRDARDSAFGGTPLGWAQHYMTEGAAAGRDGPYAAIAAYLRGLDAGAADPGRPAGAGTEPAAGSRQQGG